MCGILGVISRSTQTAPLSDVLIENGLRALELRGPDGQKVQPIPNGFLAHTRLAIIDPTERGTQPMQDESGRFTIVFNGEIYNYKALRQQLEQKGISFTSNSDTEVLLHMYKVYGADALQHLNGCFAFAVYDAAEDHVFLARDRIGINPLVYFQSHETFGFASEIKGLLPFIDELKIDKISLFTYLQFNYVPAPHSMLQSVKKLLPGHYTYVKRDDAGKFQVAEPVKWYTIPIRSANFSHINPQQYDKVKKQFVDILESSVQDRLVADVPLGSFLSGGIDSSSIAAMAVRHKPDLKTFSIGYKNNPHFDESKYAEMVASHLKTDHQTFMLSNDDLFAHANEVLNYLDEPFADSSALAVYILSKKVRQHVTVALSGDGADELFTGYYKHQAEFQMRYPDIRTQALMIAHPILKMLPQTRQNKVWNFNRQLVKFGDLQNGTNKERYWSLATFRNEELANYLIKETWYPKFQRLSDNAYSYKKRKEDILQFITKEGGLNEVLLTDVRTVLSNDMLHKVDSMSMANSLEVRTPFLDHRMVNFAFSQPVAFKINANIRKKVVQDSMREFLPEALFNRPKHGFEVPLRSWFLGPMKEKIDEYLSEDFIKQQGIFNFAAIENERKRVFQKIGKGNEGVIWNLLVFQHWWERIVQK